MAVGVVVVLSYNVLLLYNKMAKALLIPPSAYVRVLVG